MSLGLPNANKALPCVNGMRNVIKIDGSLLEGGGQILRNTAAYACITGTSVHIQNIRSKRAIPGIKAQQLDGLELLAEISNGIVQNGHVGGRDILFHPGIGTEELPTEVIVDQKLGSVKVTFQSALPVLLFARQQTTLVLRGRTDEPKSPAADYMQYILLPFLSTHFAIDCDLNITKRCCSNQSDGEMIVTIKPVERKLRCISLLEKGRLSSITGVIWTTEHEYKILTLALQFGIKRQLAAQHIRVMPTFIQTAMTPSKSGGIGILLFAETSNHHRIAASTMLEVQSTSSFQEQLKCATLQGQQVAIKLAEQLANGGVVDEYLADQLIIFMALATSGIQPSTSQEDDEIVGYRRCEILTGRPSLHTLTAMRIAETMLGNIIFSTRTISGIGEAIICERKSATDTKQE